MNEVVRDEHWYKVLGARPASWPVVSGKWIVFVRRDEAFVQAEDTDRLLAGLRRVLQDCQLSEAWLAHPLLDLAIFFTSASREEIWRVQQCIRDGLESSVQDMFWKPDFESDTDWEPGRGYLWFIDELCAAYEAVLDQTRTGDVDESQRIGSRRLMPLITGFRRRVIMDHIGNRKSMVVHPLFPVDDYHLDPNSVFVLMPFSEPWSDDLFHTIKKSGEALGLVVSRADNHTRAEHVMNDVWRGINQAGLIVADVTVQNPNVFYELGAAHAVGKKVVILRQETADELPFDVASWRHFDYALNPVRASQLDDELRRIFADHLAGFSQTAQNTAAEAGAAEAEQATSPERLAIKRFVESLKSGKVPSSRPRRRK